jgi:hypothetical protein
VLSKYSLFASNLAWEECLSVVLKCAYASKTASIEAKLVPSISGRSGVDSRLGLGAGGGLVLICGASGTAGGMQDLELVLGLGLPVKSLAEELALAVEEG